MIPITPSEQDKKLYKAWTKNVFTKSLTLLTLIIGSHPDKCDSSLSISECIIVLYVAMRGGVWLYFILWSNMSSVKIFWDFVTWKKVYVNAYKYWMCHILWEYISYFSKIKVKLELWTWLRPMMTPKWWETLYDDDVMMFQQCPVCVLRTNGSKQ